MLYRYGMSFNTQILLDRYMACRAKTRDICAPLEIEDYVVQPRPEVSPPKWHLAHSTWFWEEVVLKANFKAFRAYNESYRPLFNSYYHSLGQHWAQAERGNLSRPTVHQVRDYRAYIDQQMQRFLETRDLDEKISFLVELGIQHEQQHQELLLMDIKSILASNFVQTRYASTRLPSAELPIESWKTFTEAVHEIGFAGKGFAFDNEKPRHKVYMYPFEMKASLVTNREYLSFIESKGYENPKYWLSLGWEWVQGHLTREPMYWRKRDGNWFEYTLYGEVPLDLNAPVVHINYFEADAFARWHGSRLPKEEEIEVFLQRSESTSESSTLHPVNANASKGQVWCWTRSSYNAYPGFQTFEGSLEEYNGKFMCNQMVLRGGCVVTPESHHRDSYRNFYQPEQRWQFSGLRLARDIK